MPSIGAHYDGRCGSGQACRLPSPRHLHSPCGIDMPRLSYRSRICRRSACSAGPSGLPARPLDHKQSGCDWDPAKQKLTGGAPACGSPHGPGPPAPDIPTTFSATTCNGLSRPAGFAPAQRSLSPTRMPRRAQFRTENLSFAPRTRRLRRARPNTGAFPRRPTRQRPWIP